MKGKKKKESDGVRKKKRKKRGLVTEKDEKEVDHEADIQAELLTGEVVGQGTINGQEARREDEAGKPLGSG